MRTLSWLLFSNAVGQSILQKGNLFNGNYVSKATHALSDPYRYRFMPRSWKESNAPMGVLKSQFTRLPNVYKGMGIGAGYSYANKYENED